MDVKAGPARAKRYWRRRSLTVRVRVNVTVRLPDGRRVSAGRGYRC